VLHRATVDEIASSRSLARSATRRSSCPRSTEACTRDNVPAGRMHHAPTLHTAHSPRNRYHPSYIHIMHLTSPVISQSYAGRWKTQDRTKSRRRRRLFARSCRFSSPSILSVIFQSHIVNANASTSTTKQCIA